MAENTAAVQETAQENESYTVKFKKPYKWEGKEYTEVDLSGLAQLKVADLIAVQKELITGRNTATLALTAMEATTPFAVAVATRVTGRPVEFFERMKAAPMQQVQLAVLQALASEAESEGHVLNLSEPYTYAGANADKLGEVYTSVDLSDAENLTALDISAGENKMAKDGFPVVNKERNYRYISAICARCTGLPEDFFTGLPARDGVALRNLVNGEDFFG